MIIFGDRTITLFNRTWDEDTETETWHATKLIRCGLTMTKSKGISSSSGQTNNDAVALYVDPAEQAKEWVEPKQYSKLEDVSNVYTFTPQIDFFVEGDKTSVEQTDNFYEYMLNAYDHVYKVTSWQEFKPMLPHLEIGGR